MNIKILQNSSNKQYLPIDEEKNAKYMKYRYHVLKQWIDTEINYLKDLRIIQTKIQQPLDKKNLIKKNSDQQKILFFNIDSLIALSQNLLKQLQNLMIQFNLKPNQVKIAPTLKKYHPFFKIYLQYCNNYQKGQTILKSIEYQQSYQQIQYNLNGLDINSYLIKPVQRPPKYMLLLKDYRNHMFPNHPDYIQLQQVIMKYSQVNQINNEALQKQERQQKMIKLTNLYSRLIQRSRQFLRQFNSQTIQCKICAYVFTDLILITKIIFNKEQLYQIIQLDGSSYIVKQPDGKYYSNKIFVCGKFQCLHFIFNTKVQATHFYKFVFNLIQKIQSIQESRKKVISQYGPKQQVKIKMTLNKRVDSQNPLFPDFKLSIQGVQKRPISVIKNETVYIIKYQLNKNQRVFQYVYTRFSLLEAIYEQLIKLSNSIPSLAPKILDVNLYDQKKNKTKIIQFRAILIIEFLNAIFRNSAIMMNHAKLIIDLKIKDQLFQYAIKKNLIPPERLNQFYQNSFKQQLRSSFNHNQKQGKQQQSQLFKKIFQKNKDKLCCVYPLNHINFPTSFDHYLYQKAKLYENNNNQICFKKFVQSQQKIINYPKTIFDTLEKVIVCLDAYQGRIDHFFLPIIKQNQIQYKIKIWHYIDLRQKQIQITINQHTTVSEAIYKISKEFNIKNPLVLNDFGLFLDYSNVPRLLDNDQLILDIIQQIQGQIQVIQQNGFFSSISSGMFNKIKQVFVGKKSKLIFKKYFFLTSQLQRKSYHQNQTKYKMIIQQALYFIRYGIIILNPQQLIMMVALYLIIKEPVRLNYLNIQKFPKDTIKRFLKDNNNYYLLDNHKWLEDVISKVQQFNIKYTSFQNKHVHKIFYIYDKILDIVEHKINWKSCLFNVTNRYPQTVPGNHVQLLIGVNYKYVYLILPQNECQLKDCLFPVDSFDYRITPFSISFVIKQLTFRFDGRLLYNLSKMIKRYKLYNQIFWGKKNEDKEMSENQYERETIQKYF